MSRSVTPPRPRRCPACDGHDLRTVRVCANGGYGPTLLPGLGRLFRPAKLDVVACAGCGLVSFYLPGEMLENLAERPGRWRRVT